MEEALGDVSSIVADPRNASSSMLAAVVSPSRRAPLYSSNTRYSPVKHTDLLSTKTYFGGGFNTEENDVGELDKNYVDFLIQSLQNEVSIGGGFEWQSSRNVPAMESPESDGVLEKELSPRSTRIKLSAEEELRCSRSRTGGIVRPISMRQVSSSDSRVLLSEAYSEKWTPRQRGSSRYGAFARSQRDDDSEVTSKVDREQAGANAIGSMRRSSNSRAEEVGRWSGRRLDTLYNDISIPTATANESHTDVYASEQLSAAPEHVAAREPIEHRSEVGSTGQMEQRPPRPQRSISPASPPRGSRSPSPSRSMGPSVGRTTGSYDMNVSHHEDQHEYRPVTTGSWMSERSRAPDPEPSFRANTTVQVPPFDRTAAVNYRAPDRAAPRPSANVSSRSPPGRVENRVRWDSTVKDPLRGDASHRPSFAPPRQHSLDRSMTGDTYQPGSSFSNTGGAPSSYDTAPIITSRSQFEVQSVPQSRPHNRDAAGEQVSTSTFQQPPSRIAARAAPAAPPNRSHPTPWYLRWGDQKEAVSKQPEKAVSPPQSLPPVAAAPTPMNFPPPSRSVPTSKDSENFSMDRPPRRFDYSLGDMGVKGEPGAAFDIAAVLEGALGFENDDSGLACRPSMYLAPMSSPVPVYSEKTLMSGGGIDHQSTRKRKCAEAGSVSQKRRSLSVEEATVVEDMTFENPLYNGVHLTESRSATVPLDAGTSRFPRNQRCPEDDNAMNEGVQTSDRFTGKSSKSRIHVDGAGESERDAPRYLTDARKPCATAGNVVWKQQSSNYEGSSGTRAHGASSKVSNAEGACASPLAMRAMRNSQGLVMRKQDTVGMGGTEVMSLAAPSSVGDIGADVESTKRRSKPRYLKMLKMVARTVRRSVGASGRKGGAAKPARLGAPDEAEEVDDDEWLPVRATQTKTVARSPFGIRSTLQSGPRATHKQGIVNNNVHSQNAAAGSVSSPLRGAVKGIGSPSGKGLVSPGEDVVRGPDATRSFHDSRQVETVTGSRGLQRAAMEPGRAGDESAGSNDAQGAPSFSGDRYGNHPAHAEGSRGGDVGTVYEWDVFGTSDAVGAPHRENTGSASGVSDIPRSLPSHRMMAASSGTDYPEAKDEIVESVALSPLHPTTVRHQIPSSTTGSATITGHDDHVKNGIDHGVNRHGSDAGPNSMFQWGMRDDSRTAQQSASDHALTVGGDSSYAVMGNDGCVKNGIDHGVQSHPSAAPVSAQGPSVNVRDANPYDSKTNPNSMFQWNMRGGISASQQSTLDRVLKVDSDSSYAVMGNDGRVNNGINHGVQSHPSAAPVSAQEPPVNARDANRYGSDADPNSMFQWDMRGDSRTAQQSASDHALTVDDDSSYAVRGNDGRVKGGIGHGVQSHPSAAPVSAQDPSVNVRDANQYGSDTNPNSMFQWDMRGDSSAAQQSTLDDALKVGGDPSYAVMGNDGRDKGGIGHGVPSHPSAPPVSAHEPPVNARDANQYGSDTNPNSIFQWDIRGDSSAAQQSTLDHGDSSYAVMGNDGRVKNGIDHDVQSHPSTAPVSAQEPPVNTRDANPYGSDTNPNSMLQWGMRGDSSVVEQSASNHAVDAVRARTRMNGSATLTERQEHSSQALPIHQAVLNRGVVDSEGCRVGNEDRTSSSDLLQEPQTSMVRDPSRRILEAVGSSRRLNASVSPAAESVIAGASIAHERVGSEMTGSIDTIDAPISKWNRNRDHDMIPQSGGIRIRPSEGPALVGPRISNDDVATVDGKPVSKPDLNALYLSPRALQSQTLEHPESTRMESSLGLTGAETAPDHSQQQSSSRSGIVSEVQENGEVTTGRAVHGIRRTGPLTRSVEDTVFSPSANQLAIGRNVDAVEGSLPGFDYSISRTNDRTLPQDVVGGYDVGRTGVSNGRVARSEGHATVVGGHEHPSLNSVSSRKSPLRGDIQQSFSDKMFAWGAEGSSVPVGMGSQDAPPRPEAAVAPLLRNELASVSTLSSTLSGNRSLGLRDDSRLPVSSGAGEGAGVRECATVDDPAPEHVVGRQVDDHPERPRGALPTSNLAIPGPLYVADTYGNSLSGHPRSVPDANTENGRPGELNAQPDWGPVLREADARGGVKGVHVGVGPVASEIDGTGASTPLMHAPNRQPRGQHVAGATRIGNADHRVPQMARVPDPSMNISVEDVHPSAADAITASLRQPTAHSDISRPFEVAATGLHGEAAHKPAEPVTTVTTLQTAPMDGVGIKSDLKLPSLSTTAPSHGNIDVGGTGGGTMPLEMLSSAADHLQEPAGKGRDLRPRRKVVADEVASINPDNLIEADGHEVYVSSPVVISRGDMAAGQPPLESTNIIAHNPPRVTQPALSAQVPMDPYPSGTMGFREGGSQAVQAPVGDMAVSGPSTLVDKEMYSSVHSGQPEPHLRGGNNNVQHVGSGGGPTDNAVHPSFNATPAPEPHKGNTQAARQFQDDHAARRPNRNAASGDNSGGSFEQTPLPSERMALNQNTISGLPFGSSTGTNQPSSVPVLTQNSMYETRSMTPAVYSRSGHVSARRFVDGVSSSAEVQGEPISNSDNDVSTAPQFLYNLSRAPGPSATVSPVVAGGGLRSLLQPTKSVSSFGNLSRLPAINGL